MHQSLVMRLPSIVVAGLAVAALPAGCTKSRADICDQGRARSMSSSEFVQELMIDEAASDEKADAKRIVADDKHARDAVFMGLCERADDATLACIQRGNAAFKEATKAIERSCGPAPSIACRSEIYDAMEVGNGCGDRLLAFEMLLQEAARESHAKR